MKKSIIEIFKKKFKKKYKYFIFAIACNEEKKVLCNVESEFFVDKKVTTWEDFKKLKKEINEHLKERYSLEENIRFDITGMTFLGVERKGE